MKRLLLLLFLGWFTLHATAQRATEQDSLRSERRALDERLEQLRLFDSIAHLPLPSVEPTALTKSKPASLRIAIPHSSIYRLEIRGLPTRIYVINNISLQVGGYINLTNGQAWIWSPYPNGSLDARTLSMPLPR